MVQKLTSTIVVTSGLVVLSFCSVASAEQNDKGENHEVHWGYESDDGPGQWGRMNPDWASCAAGREQSPVDLSGAESIHLPAATIDVPNSTEVELLNQAGVVNALDNGHTVQINSRTGEKMTVGGRTFELVQFHFHAPSEHTIDGRHAPMEVHFVHQAEDGALAVVGVLLEEGDENPGIAPLWEQIGRSHGTKTSVRLDADFADSVFPDVGSGYYHYMGSLTTPPCSEGVSWFVRKFPTELSKEQISEFTAVYDHNNRPVQPLFERSLYLDEEPDIDIY